MLMNKVVITKPVFDEQEINKLQKCLDSGWVTQGPFVKEFEQKFSERHAVKYALATTSCTAALHMSILALGVGAGDEVIVPAFTWVTSAHCVEYAGAKVVFCDVDPTTFNIDPQKLEEEITSKTKAIVAVHLFGLSAPMDEILSMAKKHNLKVIEDAACATGSTYNGKPVGGFGDFGCFSFHPRKVITTGEGGMVTTNDQVLASEVQILRNHGATGPSSVIPREKPYHMGTFNALGFNLRMSDIQAAVGVAQMAKLDSLLEKRRQLADSYTDKLVDINGIVTPYIPEGCEHSFQSYVLRVLGTNAHNKRNAIMDRMAEQGIQTRPGTHAVHRLGYYADKYGIESGHFPNASLCEDTTITLPVFHDMTEHEQDAVVNIIREML
jgi:dTDP-4-amino-4,6-dideoxygalactose transaminase